MTIEVFVRGNVVEGGDLLNMFNKLKLVRNSLVHHFGMRNKCNKCKSMDLQWMCISISVKKVCSYAKGPITEQ
jgi:hypothetical protein